MKAKCLSPVTAWKCGYLFCKTDKVISPRLVFSYKEAERYHSACGSSLSENEIKLPCGHCAACLLLKRKDMSTRLAHEARMHQRMCFITLTYDDDNVPTTDLMPLDKSKVNAKYFSRGSHGLSDTGLELPLKTLLPSDVQKFMKRLRRYLEYVPAGCKVYTFDNGFQVVRDRHGNYVRDHASHVRYFAVGEYGTKTGRPHYHILIFGWCPSDREFFSSRKGNAIYTSASLSALWPFGFSSVGDVNPKVCKYCARYVTKKFVSKSDIDNRIVPEFILQSVRGGAMGASWFMQFGEEAVRRGFCTVANGDNIVKCRVPPYYMSLARKCCLRLWLDVRDERLEFIRAHKGEDMKLDDLKRKCDCAKLQDMRLCQDDLF